MNFMRVFAVNDYVSFDSIETNQKNSIIGMIY
jgi:hypothetical protein